MSNVSENIKKYRLSAAMTQEALAAKLNVTRQAVSNWENGRTQPDLETLRAVADIFDTDELGLLYDIRTTPEKYPINKPLRVRIALMAGGLAGMLALIRLTWLTQEYLEYGYYRFIMWPVYLSSLVVQPLLSAAVCIFILGLLSVWKDIRIRSTVVRKVFMVAAMTFFVLYYGLVLLLHIQILPYSLINFAISLMTHPEGVFYFIGITAFLGFNR